MQGTPSTKQMSCMRRIFAEACTTVASNIKSEVEASDDAAVKRLAPADRAQRLADERARLKGLQLRGHSEPGDSLVDKAVAIYESDRLLYQEPSSCVSLEHESAMMDRRSLLSSAQRACLGESQRFEVPGSIILSKSGISNRKPQAMSPKH